jgi:glycosyltransferase involved in cell wall biosynthesis
VKIALVFDDLIQYGGAEKLLLSVTEIWPDAPVFTPLATSEWEKICQEKQIKLCTSFMQKLPFKKKLNRFYSIFGLHMLAFESFDFTYYDLVLSISSRYAHGVITKPNTKHICYMNSPGRMFWESSSYFKNESLITKLFQYLIRPFLSHARNWDYIASKRVDRFLANSPIPQASIKKYYGKEAVIVFPPVSFPENIELYADAKLQAQKYYLLVTRLSPWKRIDIAVKACAKLNLHLKIVGEGSALSKLQKLANTFKKDSLIEFLGYVSDEEKWRLMKNCQALIMTQKEDFGIAPLEVMSAGRPVLAYREGGALIYVTPGRTGEFFAEQTAVSLIKVLQVFNPEQYSFQDCQKQAREFSSLKFQAHLQDEVNRVYYNGI